MTDKRSYLVRVGTLLTGLAICLHLSPTAHAAEITVTTTADELSVDGNCSLREAIRAVNLNTSVDACAAGNGADVIHLPGGIYMLMIDGQNEDAAATGDLDITSDLRLTGALSSTTVIDGNGLDRIFETLGDSNVTISNITIRHGSAAGNDGGGIHNAGKLTLDHTIVMSNTADAVAGGGISNSGTLTVTNSTISDNGASAGGGINNDGMLIVTNSAIGHNTGGGITNAGRVVIASSRISQNTAQSSGGGIANFQGSLAIDSSEILSNTAELGGGIRNSGTLTVTNSTIRGNAGEIGGGIANNSSGSATVITSTISNNGGSGVDNFSPLQITSSTISNNGTSGLFNDTSGVLTVMNSTISGNAESGVNNRGTLSLTNTALISNTALIDGGGIANSGTATVINSTISGNNAPGNGGGIANGGQRIALNSVTITNNTANSQGGGQADGGGIYTSSGGVFELRNTIVAGNMVTANGSESAVHPDCLGAFNSLGYNLVGDRAGVGCSGFTAGGLGDLVGDSTSDGAIDPRLGPLENNGGSTKTHALLNNSSAIDAGNPAPPASDVNACPKTDQRGIGRPQGIRCDIGAYERAAPPIIQKGFIPSTIVRGGTATLAFTITNSMNSDAITGVSFVDRMPVELKIAATPNLTNTCEGTVTALAGTGLIRLDSATLAAGAQCAIDVAITSTVAATYTNTTEPIKSLQTGTGGASNSATLTVSNPVPSVISVAPSRVIANGPAFTLIVSGTNFIEGATVLWNGSARPTTFISSTLLMASIAAADITTGGAATVAVRNPNPSGGDSNMQIVPIVQRQDSPTLFFIPLITKSP